MIAGDGACIPDGGAHAPLLCPEVVPENLLLLDRVLAFQQRRLRGFKTKCYVYTVRNMAVANGNWFEGCTCICFASHNRLGVLGFSTR